MIYEWQTPAEFPPENKATVRAIRNLSYTHFGHDRSGFMLDVESEWSDIPVTQIWPSDLKSR